MWSIIKIRLLIIYKKIKVAMDKLYKNLNNISDILIKST